MRQSGVFLLLCISLCCLGDRVQIFRRLHIEEIIHKATYKAVTSPVSDSGHAKICGPPNERPEGNITWTPKTISSSTDHLDINVEMTTVVGLNAGKVHLTVAQKEDPSTALVDMTQDGSCKEIQKYVETITCPIKPKQKVKATYRVEGSIIGIVPPGQFIVSLNITNNANQLFICVNLEITKEDNGKFQKGWMDKEVKQLRNFLKDN